MRNPPTVRTRQQERAAERTKPILQSSAFGNRALRREAAAAARGKVRPVQMSFKQAMQRRQGEPS